MPTQTNQAEKSIRVSPRGFITVDLPSGPLRMRLGFSEMADADEFLGRSLMGALSSDPLNFHNLRVAVYFAAREQNTGIKSVKAVGKLLEGIDLEVLSEAVGTALRAGGILKDVEETAEAEEESPGED